MRRDPIRPDVLGAIIVSWIAQKFGSGHQISRASPRHKYAEFKIMLTAISLIDILIEYP